ncbi:hypothetical protein ACIBCN_19010 [Nocardia sp. NPDC051052]
MAAILWIFAFAAGLGMAFTVVVVLWPDRRHGPSVADIQRKLADEQRASQ